MSFLWYSSQKCLLQAYRLWYYKFLGSCLWKVYDGCWRSFECIIECLLFCHLFSSLFSCYCKIFYIVALDMMSVTMSFTPWTRWRLGTFDACLLTAKCALCISDDCPARALFSHDDILQEQVTSIYQFCGGHCLTKYVYCPCWRLINHKSCLSTPNFLSPIVNCCLLSSSFPSTKRSCAAL